MKKNLMIFLGLLAAAFLILICMWIASFVFVSVLGVNLNPTPLTLIQYINAYPDNKTVIKAAQAGGFAGVITPILIAFLIFFLMKKKQSLFGDAQLANIKEIKENGLVANFKKLGNSVFIGKIKQGFFAFIMLVFKGAQFLIVVAPTRSGKGVSFVIPNLLTYLNSIVVLDIKQENWGITSKVRKYILKNECFLFNPMARDFKTHRYNPLGYINADSDIFRVHDTQKIGQMLYPAPEKGDDIWASTARNLFVGIVLMLIETGQKVNLGNVLDQASQGDGQKYLQDIIDKQKAIGKPLSKECEQALNAYVSMASENTRSGVLGHFRTSLQLWSNPLVRAATEENDFNFNDLRKKKMSIYVGAKPNDLDDLQPLLNLFFQQLIDENLQELPEDNPKELKHDVLLLMDEFTSIGKIPSLMKGVAYIAGYGLRLAPIIQSMTQLRSVYGEDDANTFVQNIACYIAFPPSKKDIKGAKDLSESLGYLTVKSQSRDLKKRTQGSESDHQRALFLPQEITSIGQNKSIVIIDNMNPIIANKIAYYDDPFFVKRLEVVSGVKATGFDIKKNAQLGLYAEEIPVLDIASKYLNKNDKEEEKNASNLGKNLQRFLHNTESVLNGFKLKNLLIKQASDSIVDAESESSILDYIDNLIDTALYEDKVY